MEKNIFELMTKNLMKQNPKKIVRGKLDFSDIKQRVSKDLKKNQSYLSLLLGSTEIFLGAVNLDISRIPVGDLGDFGWYMTCKIQSQLEDFLFHGNPELVSKLLDYIKNEYHQLTPDFNYIEPDLSRIKTSLTYIVKPNTKGLCLNFDCILNFETGYFGLHKVNSDYMMFDPGFLAYWDDRKAFFC